MNWLLVTCLALTSAVYAGGMPGREEATVRGEIVADDGPLVRNDLMVELINSASMRPGMKTAVPSSGSFEFMDVPFGQYEMRVTDLYGNILHRDYIAVSDENNRFSVRLPSRKVEQRPGGTISVTHLRHKPPKEALKLVEKARKAVKKGDQNAAFGHMQKAVATDPEFVEARDNLGAMYIRMNQPARALEQFQKAVAIDPSSEISQANLALTLLTLNRNQDAEEAARRSVELDGTVAKSHYMLGLALVRQNKYTEEAFKNLVTAAEKIPQAHVTLGFAYAKTGRVDDARKELTTYLSLPNAPNHEAVQQMLAKLNGGEQAAQADSQ